MGDKDKSRIRFTNGTDYLSKNGWERAEIGDKRNVGTGNREVLPRTAQWLVDGGVAEWVRDDKEDKK